MGCHTWTYKKFKSCNKKTKENFLKRCNDIVSEIYNISLEEYRKVETDVCDSYINHAKKQNDKKSVEEWEEYKKGIDSRYQEEYNSNLPFRDGVTEENVTEYCKKHYNSADIHIINDTLYLQIGFDEPFRLYGYPEETFTDKDKLLQYLSTKSNLVEYYDYSLDLSIGGYTNNLIDRINAYFEKHGEDNLYF